MAETKTTTETKKKETSGLTLSPRVEGMDELEIEKRRPEIAKEIKTIEGSRTNDK